MMKHNYSDYTDEIELRPMVFSDIEAMRQLRNQNRKYFLCSDKITSTDQQRWYNRYLETPDDYMFSIFQQKRWIGAVALYNIKYEERIAEFGRLMIVKSTVVRKGLGTVATICACKIGFEQLGLSKIYLEVYEDNLPAIKTYERAGFFRCGERVDSTGRTILNMICKRKEELINGNTST